MSWLATFVLDAPDSETGVETHLRIGNRVFSAPADLPRAPLEGAGEWLIGTMDHSVVGQRWVYDACRDPVYSTALAATVLNGQLQAKQYLDNRDRYAGTKIRRWLNPLWAGRPWVVDESHIPMAKVSNAFLHPPVTVAAILTFHGRVQDV